MLTGMAAVPHGSLTSIPACVKIRALGGFACHDERRIGFTNLPAEVS
jgi:hypothetical protein